jgi:hypothetical protein
VPTPFNIGSLSAAIAVPVVGTAKATPTTAATVIRGGLALLGRVHVANIMASGTGVREQVWVGVRRQGDTGATWEAFMAPILFDGEMVSLDLAVILGEFDEVVAYASAASKVNILLEYEEGRR